MSELHLDSQRVDVGLLVSPTFQHALAFWWAFTWRFFIWWLGALVVLWVPMFGLQLFGAILRIPQGVFQIVGLAIIFGVQIFVFREILDKEFRNFRVCLTSKSGGAAG